MNRSTRTTLNNMIMWGSRADVLDLFQPAVADWFRASFEAPTPPQAQGWPAIARGESTLILAPTGSGKTLAAFLWCINRLMFDAGRRPKAQRCRVLYISPLKALAVDVERNLRAPLAGIANRAAARGDALPRAGDRGPHRRHAGAPSARASCASPADILITTPESLYLLLTSNAREALRSVDTVIVDEIHALVPTKRGAHLALSLERLEALRRRGRCSGSGCRRRSGRSTRSRASSAAPSQRLDARRRGARRTTGDGRQNGRQTDRTRARSTTSSPATGGAARLSPGHDRRHRRRRSGSS